jgi:hypothetical protein
MIFTERGGENLRACITLLWRFNHSIATAAILMASGIAPGAWSVVQLSTKVTFLGGLDNAISANTAAVRAAISTR